MRSSSSRLLAVLAACSLLATLLPRAPTALDFMRSSRAPKGGTPLQPPEQP